MLSQTAEYALRAIVALAHNRSQPLITPKIAEMTRVPCGYLAKVLQALGRKGLVLSQRGLRGGFVLAREPSQLTVLEVVDAVDPVRRDPAEVKHGGNLGVNLEPLNAHIAELTAWVENRLATTTVQQLLDGRGPTEPS
jgi:Rrf2 family protein